MKYIIIIEEMISQEFEIDAKNIADAMASAEEKYANGEFILSPGNLICKQMCAVSDDKKEATDWVEF